MSYNVSSLSSASDCDAIISQVSLEKGMLEVQRSTLLNEMQAYSTNGDEFPSQISYLEEQIALAEEKIPDMPPGELRKQSETALYKMKLRLGFLNRKAEEYGAFAQLDRQFEINKLQHSIDESDVYIGELQARKTELSQVPS